MHDRQATRAHCVQPDYLPKHNQQDPVANKKMEKQSTPIKINLDDRRPSHPGSHRLGIAAIGLYASRMTNGQNNANCTSPTTQQINMAQAVQTFKNYLGTIQNTNMALELLSLLLTIAA